MNSRIFASLVGVALLAPGLASAKPTYQQARAIYDQLGVPVAATGLWHKKPLAERLAALRDAEAFVVKAEQVFGSAPVGDAAACRNAAISRKFYIIHMNDLALILEGRRAANPADVYAPMSNGVSFGEYKSACYQYIESLAPR